MVILSVAHATILRANAVRQQGEDLLIISVERTEGEEVVHINLSGLGLVIAQAYVRAINGARLF